MSFYHGLHLLTYVTTSSRDTTVKVWDVRSGEEKRNLGGHTNTVTSVQLLSAQQSQELSELRSWKTMNAKPISVKFCTELQWKSNLEMVGGKLFTNFTSFSPNHYPVSPPTFGQFLSQNLARFFFNL